jgi:phytanoyl-CoA hydroxylase
MDLIKLKQTFDAEGFVHVKGFLDKAQLEEIRKNLERYKIEVVPKIESTLVMYEIRNGIREIKQLVSMEKSDDFFHELHISSKTKDLAKALLGDDVIPMDIEHFDKPPQIGTPTPPHQDGYYFCLTPNEAVTLWVALDDCDEENGCLGYIKGSHKRGIIEHSPSGVVGFSQGLKKEIWNKKDVVSCPVKAGDCLAHHSVTIHFAGANRSENRHRRSLGFTYYSVHTKRDEEAFARYKASVAEQRKSYPEGALKTA